MAAFPSLVPSSRSYSFPEYPVTVEPAFAGGHIRFLHSSTPNGITMKLSFAALTQANAKLIRDHYRGQNGTFASFTLPAEIWTGYTSAGAITATTTSWRYLTAPTENHAAIGRITVDVELVSLT